MSGSSNFWTAASKRNFHQAITELQQKTETPAQERNYRNDALNQVTAGHVMSYPDELRIADNIAYLAQVEEGVQTISAVTLQESPASIRILVASNHTPAETTVRGLQEMMTIVSEYATKVREQRDHRQRLFEKVVALCRTRILRRIRPPWLLKLSYIGGPREPLLETVQWLLTRLNTMTLKHPSLPDLLTLTQDLIHSLETLAHQEGDDARENGIRHVIHACANMTTLNGQRTLAGVLATLGGDTIMSEKSRLEQIDKMARYLHICKDFIRLARKIEYRHLFRQITVRSITSFQGFSRDGATNQCFVHAEVLQVLHYERHPHHPPPRAIGSSKSACYLCDLFIRHHAKYKVSCTHGLLFDQWTLPDVGWMTKSQARVFRRIIENMTLELRDTINSISSSRFGKAARMHRPQSRAPTPASGGSVPSTVSVATLRPTTLDVQEAEETAAAPEDTKEIKSNAESDSISSIVSLKTFKVSAQDLPFRYNFKPDHATLRVEIENLSLLFDVSYISSTCLSINRSAPSSEDLIQVVDVLSLPTDRESELSCDPRANKSRFRVQVTSRLLLDVELLRSS